MITKTTCNKCGKTFYLDFGNMAKDEAIEKFKKMDQQGFHCPGHHVELGGVFEMWNLNDAIHRAYDLSESEELEVPTDEEFVKRMLDEGRDVVDGGANKVPQLKLPNIHGIRGLVHLGMGQFRSETHNYIRRDSPLGTRFYERVPIQEKQHAM